LSDKINVGAYSITHSHNYHTKPQQTPIDNGRSRKSPGGRGYITSTPKSGHFLKKQQKRAKYERASCMPGPKNGERPYLAVPEPTFWGLFFASFCPNFLIFLLPSLPTNFNFCAFIFLLYYYNHNLTPGMSLTTNTHTHNPSYTTKQRSKIREEINVRMEGELNRMYRSSA